MRYWGPSPEPTPWPVLALWAVAIWIVVLLSW